MKVGSVRKHDWGFFLILILLLPISCTTSGTSPFVGTTSPNYTITWNRNPNRFNLVYCIYEDYFFILRSVKKQLDDRLAPPAICEAEMAAIPMGGRLVISLFSHTIHTASLENYEFIVMKGDREIFRRWGPPMIPSWIERDFWGSTYVIDLKEEFEDQITLYVVSKFPGGRDQFLIQKNN